MFAYGNREQILRNPDVRRHYIGERFDVGHLLDQRRPVSIPHSAPADTGVSTPGDQDDSSSTFMGQYVTTEMIAGQVDDLSVQSTQVQMGCSDPENEDDTDAKH